MTGIKSNISFMYYHNLNLMLCNFPLNKKEYCLCLILIMKKGAQYGNGNFFQKILS